MCCSIVVGVNVMAGVCLIVMGMYHGCVWRELHDIDCQRQASQWFVMAVCVCACVFV